MKLGFELHTTDICISRALNRMIDESVADRATPAHGRILGFVEHENRMGRDVYQKDLEAELGITRSSVTNLLQLMEKKGYIRRVDVMSDARLKRIVLTDKGHEVLRCLDRCIDRMEDHLHSLLTPDEVDTLIELLHKLRDGMPEEGLSCPPPPDEICCIELQNKELEGHR